MTFPKKLRRLQVNPFDHEYNQAISQLDEQIRQATELRDVNIRLMALNQVFLHPYSQGMDIGIVRRLLDEPESKEKIMIFFGRKFLDLRGTIHIIDGMYKQRAFLKDFALPIEESLVL